MRPRHVAVCLPGGHDRITCLDSHVVLRISSASAAAESGPLGLPDEISREPRQPIVLTVSPTIIEADILTLDDTGFVETSTDDCNERRVDLGRTTAEQRRRRAAEQRDELAPLHSITSSARCCKNHGTSSPSALAVLRLMTRSNLVGCTTGKSPGLAPLRIRSTYAAERLTISAVLGP